jgi:two-component system, chemotaxis family, chemotaxis protein CheY
MSRSIVIADDTAYMRALIRETLSSVGLVIAGEATDGPSALDMYRQKQPDLIILNLVMPQNTGMQTLKHIKAWDPHAKILVCSALGQAPTIFSAIRSGANDFLVKPFDPQRLIDVVHKLLNINFTHHYEH